MKLCVSVSKAQQNPPDRRLGNTIAFGQLALGNAPTSVSRPCRPNFSVSQFRLGVLASGASSIPLAALQALVDHVVGACSKKQVPGITARRIVATMQNTKPFWDRAVVNLKRYAVRSLLRSIKSQFSVSTVGDVTRPSPAIFCPTPDDVIPETVDLVPPSNVNLSTLCLA